MKRGFNNFKSSTDSHWQLGELLHSAGLVSQEVIDRVVNSNCLGPRLGQMLILSGFISHDELQYALRAQCILRERVLEKSIVIQALNLTRTQRITLDEALLSLNATIDTTPSIDKRLGGLLVDASVITEEELNEGLAMAKVTGLPLGRVLVIAGIVHEEELRDLVHIQTRLRGDTIDRDEAVKEIACLRKDIGDRDKQPTHNPKALEPTLNEPVLAPQHTTMYPKRRIPTEELLLSAGLISQGQLVFSIQESAITCTRPEEVLVAQGAIDADLAQSARKLSDMTYNGDMDFRTATQLLSRFVADRRAQSEPAARDTQASHSTALPHAYPQSLLDFLVLCNVITDDQRRRTRQMRSGTKLDDAAVLVYIHALSETEMEIASMCFQCLHDSVLTLDQAIFANRLFSKAVQAGALSLQDFSQALGNPQQFQTIVRQLTARATVNTGGYSAYPAGVQS